MMLINTLAGPRLRESVLLAEQVLVHGIFRHLLYRWIRSVARHRAPVGPTTKKVNSLIVIHKKNNTNSTHNNTNTQQSQQRKTVTHNNNHHTQPLQQKEHNNNTQNTLAN